jgi:hypothetical protein
MMAERHREPFNVVISGRAILARGPESILPAVVMDSGLDASRRPGMTAVD